MAFLAPAIVGALGLVGTTALIAQAVIGTAIGLGIGYLAQKLFAPTPPKQPRGIQQGLQLSTNVPRSIVVGKCAVAGSLHYWQFTGANNNVLKLVIALSDWPSGNITGLYVDGRRIILNGDGSVGAWASIQTVDTNGNVIDTYNSTTNKYHGHIHITYYNGDWDQLADADLVSESSGNLTSDFRLRGVTYVIVKLVYDANVFPGGIPQMLFEFEGAKLYDLRKDSTAGGAGLHRWDDLTTWETTDNPGVIHYNWRRGLWYNGIHLYGMKTPAEALSQTRFAGAATFCSTVVSYYTDETHTTTANGSMYSMNGLININVENRQILSDIMACYGATESEIGGMYSPVFGAQSISATITDDDIVLDDPFRYSPYRAGGDVKNIVHGSFADPNQSYQVTDLPPRFNSTDITNDGGAYPTYVSLTYVTRSDQAQRLMELERKRQRLQKIITMSVVPELAILEVGDWVTLNIDSEGISGLTCEVMSTALTVEPKIPITLREVSTTLFDFGLADIQFRGAPKAIVDGEPSDGNVTGVVVTTFLLEASAGIQRPGLNISWDAITDPTVSTIDIEYRVVGSTSSLAKTIVDVSSTSYAFVDGIQSGVTYEMRAKPRTIPDRTTSWTGWVAASGTTDIQVVAESTSSAPGSVTVEALSAQAQLELSLTTAIDDIQGSVADRLHAIEVAIQNAGQGATGGLVIAGDARRRVTELTDTVGELSASVTTVEEVLAGQSATWTTQVTVYSGTEWITGMQTLGATATQSYAGFIVDNFFVGSVSGGDVANVTQIFTIGTRADGSYGVVFNAPVFVENSIHASALIAESITTLYAEDPTGTYYFDFANGKIGRVDGLVTIDLKNISMEWKFPYPVEFDWDFNAVYVIVLMGC